MARRAFLDTERYDAVLGGFLDGTPADGVDDRLADLRDGEGVQVATGDEVVGDRAGREQSRRPATCGPG